jgi:polysaccharide biosynthesis/export protein
VKPSIEYLVDREGKVKLPMIGEIKLLGLSLREAEAVLQKEYTKFYEHPYVIVRYQNKRVVVLGAPGGQVIPLANEQVRLVEILALAKGLQNDAKAHNIRVLRGDQVMVADLSTFEGYTKNNVIMQPGDVVYVEPVRRPVAEAVRDYGPALSIVTSLTTLLIVLISQL